MRSIQVINARRLSPAVWYALSLCRALKNAGMDVRVLTRSGSLVHQQAMEMGLQSVMLPFDTMTPGGLARLHTRLCQQVEEFAPQVVNCHFGQAFVLWGLLKLRRANFKLVRTRCDARPPRNNLVNRLLHRWVADAVIVGNSAMSRTFITNLGVAPDKLWTIHCGVDRRTLAFNASSRRALRTELGLSDRDVVVGCIERGSGGPGLAHLFDAVTTLRRDLGFSRIRVLTLCPRDDGSRSDAVRERAVRLAARKGLDDTLFLSPAESELAAAVSALDIGVAPSTRRAAAVGREILELMAVERPVLASASGAHLDLLAEAALVPPGDVPAMTLTLARYIKHPELRATLLRHQGTMLTQLGLDDLLRQTASVYQGLDAASDGQSSPVRASSPNRK